MNENKTNINWYPGHMAKTKRQIKDVINMIDIVYELVDARLPLSSKIKDINNYIFNKEKILIMTKKDLCDMDVTKKWINYYESIGYRVLCVDLNNNDDYKKIISMTNIVTKDIQEKRIKNGLKEKVIKAIVVGVPNVGKSSLINKLAGKKVSEVANKPGVTKNINWLKTKYNIEIMDTPGILWPKIDDNDEALALASTAAIKTTILNITDIGGYIISFLKNHYPTVLENKYKIDVSINENPIEIMDKIGLKMGVCKNHETDYEAVCSRVYNDVINGKISKVTFDIWNQ